MASPARFPSNDRYDKENIMCDTCTGHSPCAATPGQNYEQVAERIMVIEISNLRQEIRALEGVLGRSPGRCRYV